MTTTPSVRTRLPVPSLAPLPKPCAPRRGRAGTFLRRRVVAGGATASPLCCRQPSGEQMKMNRSVLRSILAAITSAACLVPFVIGGTAQAAWAGCQGGSMLGKGTTKLSNGFLEVWFCRYSNGRIGNVHISYSKTGGTSVIRLRFMWDRATANGIGQGIVQKDQGPLSNRLVRPGTSRGTISHPGSVLVATAPEGTAAVPLQDWLTCEYVLHSSCLFLRRSGVTPRRGSRFSISTSFGQLPSWSSSLSPLY